MKGKKKRKKNTRDAHIFENEVYESSSQKLEVASRNKREMQIIFVIKQPFPISTWRRQ